MRLPGPRRTNESQILMRSDGIQQRQRLKTVYMLALDDAEVEVVKCFRHFAREPAGAKIHIYRIADLLASKIFENLIDCRHLVLAEAEFFEQLRELCCANIQTKDLGRRFKLIERKRDTAHKITSSSNMNLSKPDGSAGSASICMRVVTGADGSSSGMEVSANWSMQ